jgi:hypothetical protein
MKPLSGATDGEQYAGITGIKVLIYMRPCWRDLFQRESAINPSKGRVEGG